MNLATRRHRLALRSRSVLRLRSASPDCKRTPCEAAAQRQPSPVRGPLVLLVFSLAAVGAGAGRALTTTYVPFLLERIDDAPALIGVVMTVNALTGFAVPLVVGLWSDRRDGRGLGRRLPFMVAGTVLTTGGLASIALGTGSSYLALGLAAALAYTGLNALTTAHRALVAEDFDDARRPRATSAQEVAGLAGAVVAVAIGGALIEPAPMLAFALVGAVVVLSALPTLILTRRRGLGTGRQPKAPRGSRARLRAALARPGAREVLVAQTLWVFSYAALPAFFVLYATDSLGLSIGAAGLLPLGFGALTAIGMLLGGRAEPERVHRLLLAGAALLGIGLLSATFAPTLAAAVLPFSAAALGAGLVTTLGFPYFARFVPAGQAGGYSGLFFSGRAVAAAVALPVAGVAAELAGTYRAVLWLGASALLALIPLTLAQRRTGSPALALLPRPTSVGAVVPVYASARVAQVTRGLLRHVDQVVLVDDGSPPEIAAVLSDLADGERVRLLRLGRNGGKGSAVAAGVDLLTTGEEHPQAIVVVDSDGQHDPDRIPAFLDAARSADVVIGSRTERSRMPTLRRIANRAASLALFASTRAWMPDPQNGMRLYRTETLRAIPPPSGRYEAESVHLRALLAAGKQVASVQIPTIYEGEPSHFRPVADTRKVTHALLWPGGSDDGGPTLPPARASITFLRHSWPRFALPIAGALAIAPLLPLLQPLDSAGFSAINGLGDGPEILYQALDPHTRNYLLICLVALTVSAARLRRVRFVAGTGVALLLAAYLSGLGLELVKLFIDRARPEEILGGGVQLSHGRHWAALASFPSGHMIVTGALAAVATAVIPRLRLAVLIYVGLVGLTRILFGAHFPIDVLVGTAFGWQVGLFSAGLVASAGLLPAAILHQPGEVARIPITTPHEAAT